jgi:2,5-diamino-6-(ribosylamino)-4(3H)-pyrimidinone 5'-phosphate reductase
MSRKCKRLIIVTSNKSHPAYSSKETNIQIIEYSGKLKMKWMLEQLALSGCKAATIQTGSTLNCEFLREHVIDKVNVVIAPILVGGLNTVSLIDGRDVRTLSDIGVLELKQVKKLKNSYIELFYDVVNNTNETSDINDLL